MSALGNILLISYILNFILIIFVIFFQRRDPVVSMAWVMCFILLPVVGMLLFLIFGQGIKNHTRKLYYEKLLKGEEMTKRLHKQFDSINKEEIKSIPDIDLIRYFLRYNFLYTQKNTVDIITDAGDKYERLIKDIENAKESVNLLYFIVRNDNIGNRIMDALVKKANEGVTVRFLYDPIGCLPEKNSFLNRLNSSKCGRAVPFYPVSFFSLSKINHRNHRKICVIDKKIAYLGGMNIGDEYMGKKKPTPWRDTHIRLIGESVKLVYKYFCLDWDFSTGENLSDTLDELFTKDEFIHGIDTVPTQIVVSGPDSPADEIKGGIIKMLNNARRYAYIQTPYFVPDTAFSEAMIMAADSGVDVRLMLPGIPDKAYVYYTSISYLEDMLKAGVKVYLYNGFLHAKTAVTDDKIATIGTTNIDIRSFRLHFELNAFFYSDNITQKCREIFLNDITHSHELTPEEYNNRPKSSKFKEALFRLFSPLM